MSLRNYMNSCVIKKYPQKKGKTNREKGFIQGQWHNHNATSAKHEKWVQIVSYKLTTTGSNEF